MNLPEHKFKMNDMVEYTRESSLPYGHGRIVGVSGDGAPVIGRTYIVEDLSGFIPNETYPFSHFSICELFLNKAN
jgi:hypothetical protein